MADCRGDGWGTWNENGLPSLMEYDIAKQIKRSVTVGAIEAGLREAEVTAEEQATLFPDPIPSPANGSEVVPWSFNQEIWDYLHNDVHVLARSMEAYHRRAEDMHRTIPLALKDGKLDGLASRLRNGPGWAFAMYCAWFMSDDTTYVLNPVLHAFVRDSLRGGRTDKRATYIEVTKEMWKQGFRMTYLDFCSLYPSVQDCEVHDTHFPVGRRYWYREAFPGQTSEADVLRQPHHQRNTYLKEKMEGWTGFLKVNTVPLAYATHPALHHVPKPRRDEDGELQHERLRQHQSHGAGLRLARASPRHGLRAEKSSRITEFVLAAVSPSGRYMAVGNMMGEDMDRFLLITARQDPEVEVESKICKAVRMKIPHSKESGPGAQIRALSFSADERNVDYVDFFFKLKADSDSSGPAPNPGLRALAKLLLNSLWGQLGQRSYAVRKWVNAQRLDHLAYEAFRKRIEIDSVIRDGSGCLHFKYRILKDISNHASTAHHIAAFVSTNISHSAAPISVTSVQ
ncbi:hypothetical protein HKX48_008314 [Thoreauomyces humboldtii]|nr:hypothetical protein HKX48_008314 [Thoreauomyces humboldtii]